MPDTSNPYNVQPRRIFINGLSRRFIQDVYAAINNAPPVLALEIINHLFGVLQLLEQSASLEGEDEGNIYKTYWEGEERLTLKWGRLIKPYRQQQFQQYFDKCFMLTEKAVISLEEYSKMSSGEEQCVSEVEMLEIVDDVRRFLETTRQTLLLEQPPSQEAMEALSKDPDSIARLQNLSGIEAGRDHDKSDNKKDKVKDKEDGEEERAFGNTKTRSRLALYYLVKAAGVEPRADSAVSALAKLAHFITGEKLTTLNNSNTYKFYLSMPEYKTAKGRLEDLNYIRPFFEELGMNKALDLIDAEMVKTNAELPHKGRK